MNGIEVYYDKKPFVEKAYKTYLHEVHAEDFVLSYLLKEGNKILMGKATIRGSAH